MTNKVFKGEKDTRWQTQPHSQVVQPETALAALRKTSLRRPSRLTPGSGEQLSLSILGVRRRHMEQMGEQSGEMGFSFYKPVAEQDLHVSPQSHHLKVVSVSAVYHLWIIV